MATVTGQDVADFLGQGDDTALVALAEEHVLIVHAMAREYTRGNGFDEIDGEPTNGLAAVITTATARMLTNPGQLGYQAGDISIRGGFQGWSLAETFVLNRYRRKAL